MDNDHVHHHEHFHNDDFTKPPRSPFRPDPIVLLERTSISIAPHLRELIINPFSVKSIFPLTYRQTLGGRPKFDFNMNFSLDAWSLLVGGYGATALGFYLEDYYEDIDFNYIPVEDESSFFHGWPFAAFWPQLIHYCRATLMFCGRFATRFIEGGLLYFGSGLLINYIFSRKWGAVTSAGAGAVTGFILSKNHGYATIFKVTTGFAFYTSIMEFIFGLFIFSFSERFDR